MQIFLFLFAVLIAVVVGIWLVGKLVGIALMLLLAGLIGAGAQSVLGYRGGFLFSIGAGLVGAVLGTILANVLNAPKFPELFNLPLLWSMVGAIGVVAAAKVVAPREDRRRLGRSDRGLLR